METLHNIHETYLRDQEKDNKSMQDWNCDIIPSYKEIRIINAINTISVNFQNWILKVFSYDTAEIWNKFTKKT